MLASGLESRDGYAAELRAIRPETQENEVVAVAEISGLGSRGKQGTIAETRTWK